MRAQDTFLKSHSSKCQTPSTFTSVHTDLRVSMSVNNWHLMSPRGLETTRPTAAGGPGASTLHAGN